MKTALNKLTRLIALAEKVEKLIGYDGEPTPLAREAQDIMAEHRGEKPGLYMVRVHGYLPCRLVSRRTHRGEVQVQFESGTRRWFPASRVIGAEKLP